MYTLLPYKKPSQRPEPRLEPAATEAELNMDRSDATNEAHGIEFIYNLARSGVFQDTTEASVNIPPWAPFHARVTEASNLEVSSVAFNPILMAPPTDHRTIYTLLKRIKEAMAELGQSYSPVVFDMGLLTKALEIVWANPVELSGVIPCAGGMHFLIAVFSGIGTLYGDAGLRQLLYESGVFAAGTVQQMLAGKDFDRALYGLKLVDEALCVRFLVQFQKWCKDKGEHVPQHVMDLLVQVNEAFETCADKSRCSQLVNELNADAKDELLPIIERFRQDGRATSPTFKLWDDFLVKVMAPFKVFVAATRNGNWKVYQGAKEELLPLIFASGRTVYARYLPVELLLTKRLPEEVKTGFQDDGLFTAKLSTGAFNRVWLDYTLEATENKALKGTGGIIGLTLRGNALRRYFLARPVTAKYSEVFCREVFQERTHKKDADVHHTDTPAQRKRWDSDVQKLAHMFEEESYIDPFQLANAPTSLVNFATGEVASLEIKESMVTCLEKGAKMAQTFVSERLVPSDETHAPKKSFYDTMSKSGVKTFAKMKKAVSVGTKKISMDGEIMYLRLAAVNAKKKVPIERLMSFENAPVPLSMFGESGAMLSGKKSDFMHKLEDLVSKEIRDKVDIPACVIHDGHALIRKLPGPSELGDKVSFRDMARSFTTYMLHLSNSASSDVPEIHIVFDRYEQVSIKSQERETRAGRQNVIQHHIRLDLPAPRNWATFLHSGENKAGLATCYTDFMLENVQHMLKPGQVLFISESRRNVQRITSDTVTDIRELHSNQEEADTRMILHAIYAANNGTTNIVVNSPDTDVLVLLVHHRPVIKAQQIFMLTGREGKHSDLTRYIPVHVLFTKLTTNQLGILLPVYCLTGCDTVSAFHGHGKRKAFRIMTSKANKFQAMTDLGMGPLTRAQKEACTQFIGLMYGQTDCNSLNHLRVQKASHSRSKMPAKKLPPTDNSFELHVLRCVFQLLIWRQAMVAMQELPDPKDYGYVLNPETNSLQPRLMSQPAAAPELLNDLVCVCDGDACSTSCKCEENEQPCTYACNCEAKMPFDCDEQGQAIANIQHCANRYNGGCLSEESDLSDGEGD